MKTKIILFIGAVALVTLSFTFAGVTKPINTEAKNTSTSSNSGPVGGLLADDVVE